MVALKESRRKDKKDVFTAGCQKPVMGFWKEGMGLGRVPSSMPIRIPPRWALAEIGDI